MPAGIQSIDVPNQMAKLRPSDLSTEAGEFDASTFVPVIPIDLQWTEMRYTNITLVEAINGATTALYDTPMTSGAILRYGEVPELQGHRYYPNLSVRFTGGAVSPISTAVTVVAGGAGTYIWEGDLVNPGTYHMGPVYVAPGCGFVIYTSTNGGVGDMARLQMTGYHGARGTPLPIIPGFTQG